MGEFETRDFADDFSGHHVRPDAVDRLALFQYFLVPLVLNSGTGAPGNATMFYNLYLYKTFFAYGNLGYGAAMAWLLFVIILIATVILFKSQKYWVYYAGDNR